MPTIIPPDVVRRTIWHHIENAKMETIDSGTVGAIIGHFQDALKSPKEPDVDAARRLVFGWVLTPDMVALQEMSSNKVFAHQFHALRRWVGAKKVGNDWIPRPTFAAEARWILTIARRDLEINRSLQAEGKMPMTMSEAIELWKKGESEKKLTEVSVEDASPAIEENPDAQAVGDVLANLKQQYGDDVVKEWLLRQ